MHIQTPDVYKDMQKYFSNIIDFSNFEKNHFPYNENNKGKLGYLKNETDKVIS